MLNIDAEKAAGVSNAAVATSRSDVGRRGGLSGDDPDRSKDELMGRARDLWIEGRSTMNRIGLIGAALSKPLTRARFSVGRRG